MLSNLINWVIVSCVNGLLRVFRLPGLNRSNVYAMLGHHRIQRVLEGISRRKAYDIYRRAMRKCPAYQAFVQESRVPRVRRFRDFERVPQTTKSNYVRKYPIESRCYGGRIPRRGVVIDESSGSSGTPNNWVRGPGERASVKRLLQHGFELTFGGRPEFVLNCFALGPWATGMNVSMSLLDAAILKSIGPDKQKLENTLRVFGTSYRYLIAGYPPFLKNFVDTTELDLKSFELHAVVGGEPISEGLRDHLLEVFRSVHSSYGASDLEINIAADTGLSIAIRRIAQRDTALCRALFKRDEPPMLFQYNPVDYYIEESDGGELVFTLLRRSNAAPKVRYNICDLGGTIPYRDAVRTLRQFGIDPVELPRPHACLPLLYVYGRSDLTVPFYGAKIFTTDIDAILNGDSELREHFNSFQLRSGHDVNLNETLTIVLERCESQLVSLDGDQLRSRFCEGLKRVNQDFREVSKMFTPEAILIEQHAFGEGPFAARDIRVKHQYIATTNPSPT